MPTCHRTEITSRDTKRPSGLQKSVLPTEWATRVTPGPDVRDGVRPSRAWRARKSTDRSPAPTPRPLPSSDWSTVAPRRGRSATDRRAPSPLSVRMRERNLVASRQTRRLLARVRIISSHRYPSSDNVFSAPFASRRHRESVWSVRMTIRFRSEFHQSIRICNVSLWKKLNPWTLCNPSCELT